MKIYLIPKLDAADDIINETFDVIDTLHANDSKENKKSEVAVLIIEVRHEELLLHTIGEVSKIMLVESPVKNDILDAESYLSDLKETEKNLKSLFIYWKELANDD